MAELTWKPDGEKIFEKLLAAIPEQMREAIKPKLMEMLSAKAAGQAVTAKIVARMVEEDLPEPQKSALMAALGLNKPDAGQPREDTVPDVSWTGNSEAMFEIMLGEVPEAMRGVFRGKLMDVISRKSKGGPVTEDQVTEVVNEIVPEPFKSNILKKFTEVGDFDPHLIDRVVERHGTAADALTYILHDVQDQIGYLPREALSAVSNKTGIALSKIYNVVTFYKSFRLERPGKHHVKLCCGTACHLNDTDGTAAQIESAIKQSPNATLEKTLCLGCCDCAPAVEVDGIIYKGSEAKNKVGSVLS